MSAEPGSGASSFVARVVRPVAAKAKGHLWLVGAAGCLWLMLRHTGVTDFRPPDKVRVDAHGVTQMVGEAPAQEFAAELANPQAVQVRASLRQFASARGEPLSLEADEAGDSRLLSQPVITTILGMSANIDQTIRLDGGDLVVHLHVEATPRVMVPAKRKGSNQHPAIVSLEHRVHVTSTRKRSFGRSDVHMVHLQAEGTLVGLDDAPHRVVFEVEGELFALDLELSAAA